MVSGPAVQRHGDGPIGFGLLVFAGRRLPVQKQKFRAQQSAAFRASGHRRNGILAGTEIGIDLDTHSVVGVAEALRSRVRVLSRLGGSGHFALRLCPARPAMAQ